MPRKMDLEKAGDPPAGRRRPTRKVLGEAGVAPLPRLPGEADPDRLAAEAQAQAAVLEQMFAPGYVAASQAERVRELLAERARRRVEALNLYEPLPVQVAFHESQARVRLLRGSNRSGKTLGAAVEVARAVCGRDPLGRYPRQDGRWYCVGKDLKHVAEVMYRKLFRAGALKMLRDELTHRWRAYRPWCPRDLARQREVRPAPPLIPPRMVKQVAWHSKAENQPSIIRLYNGWELSFYSSLGKPPQGSDVDGWWFDEEIVDGDWFPEMSARTLDRQGKGVWSATPQAGTDQLFELHERAEAERGARRPAVEEFVALLADNPHIGEEDKRALAADLSEDERKVRIGGDFAILSFKVYPEFNMLLHGADEREVPPEWARYMVVDPGHQVCAVLFAAVPPPQQGDFVLLYDELYLKECDAGKFAAAVGHRAAGQCFQSFLIDPNMAVYTEVGGGKTVAQQYGEALRARGVGSVATGSYFLLGCDDVDAGLLAVRGWLRPREDGTTKLRVMRGRLPAFDWEIKRYHRKRLAGQITDKPDNRRHTHLMDCLRYLALYAPRYVRPQRKKAPVGGAVAALRDKRDAERQRHGGTFVRLGPGANKGGGW